VVLDKRIVTKRYGAQFLQSLPPTTVRTGPLAAISSLVKRRVRPAAK
jgi:DNA polymerase-3 subunit epsilon/ATP-dependent DNA helicase DinG